MSILNIVARPNSVVMAVDTDCILTAYDDAGAAVGKARGRATKMLPLVHLPALIAYRGTSIVPAASLAASTLAASFDVLASGFGKLADGVAAAIAAQSPALAASANADHFIALAGWSDRLDRMDVSLWERTGVASFLALEFLGCVLSPAPVEDGEPCPPPPETPEAHVAVARLQAARLRAAPEDFAGGGDLVIATLTRHAIEVEIVRDFEAEGSGSTGPALIGRGLY